MLDNQDRKIIDLSDKKDTSSSGSELPQLANKARVQRIDGDAEEVEVLTLLPVP